VTHQGQFAVGRGVNWPSMDTPFQQPRAITRRVAGGPFSTGHGVPLQLAVASIFVIETKHWSGWLFGTPREKTWTRVHFRDKRQVPNRFIRTTGT